MKNEDAISDWLERDLTAAAESGQLEPAYRRDDEVARVIDLLGSGRHPIISGEAGVGKSALVHEIARRSVAGDGIPLLRGRRILQISLKSRAAALSKPANQMGPEFQKLVRALSDCADRVVPYFRDVDVAYAYDLEAQLVQLALRFEGPILAEGESGRVRSMLESEAELDRHFFVLELAEPSIPQMEDILAHWAADRQASGVTISPGALDITLEIAHRFLTRSRLPRKAIEILQQAAAAAGAGAAVSERDIIRRFQEAYRIPALLIDPEVRFDPEETSRLFKSQVLEQDEAVEATVRMMSLIKSGLSDPRRPFGAFLFVGPTGVGKTHIAQLLAEHFFGSRERLLRINMADYPGPDSPALLFGHPNSYPASARRGQLTVKLQGYPFAVLLLDEFEKAHPSLHDRFLQMFDEGAFMNGAGETVSCRSLIIIATSNAGAEVYRGQPFGFAAAPGADQLDRELDRRLLEHFRFEFLNRFDQVVHFHPLTRAGIRAIALREVRAISQRSGVRSRRVSVEVDESVLDWVTANGYDPHYGARFLRRAIERHVATALAALLVEPGLEGATVELAVRGGKVVARRIADAPVAPAAATSRVLVPGSGRARAKRLTGEALRAEGVRALSRAAALRTSLDAHRQESSKLVERMAVDGFWEDRAEAQGVLDQFRVVDVASQAEARLMEPVAALESVLADTTLPAEVLARALERALSALRDWELRQEEAGPSEVSLLLQSTDPLQDGSDWLRQLGAMLLSWLKRLNLQGEVLGAGFSDGKLNRLVLHAEGPGAGAILSMEQGVHRLHRTDQSDIRVAVSVLPASAPSSSGVAALARARTGPLGIALRHELRVEDAASGTSFRLLGPDATRLAAIGTALADQAARSDGGDREVARLYGLGPAGAQDPRTGAVVPRLKDALSGKLEPLLDAWRRRAAASEAADTAPDG